MAARKRTTKKATKKATKKTRKKSPSKRKPRKPATYKYKLSREELLELKVANMEMDQLNQKVNALVQKKLAPHIAKAQAEARDQVEGWEDKKAQLDDLQKGLQKKYAKPGYVLQDPDGETGEGVMIKKT